MSACRHVVLVLGDQLGWDSPALAGFDPAQDRLLMIEAPGEAQAVWSHRARIALFLSGMRHFANAAHRRGWPCHYVRLDAPDQPPGLPERLALALRELQPQALHVLEAGEWRLAQAIEATAQALGVPLTVHEDDHFLCSRAEFARWARGRSELRMEFFYREMRRRHGVLMDGREPVGGRWNFDADNRQGYGRGGPGPVPEPLRPAPDRVTREVLALVAQQFPDHPGGLDDFAWPVTREDALAVLAHFIEHRLPQFGPWQDAMWAGLPFGWHALIASSLNLHLLHPREVVAAAESAWRERDLPLASVEGFIRQVLGWREFVRGVYWLEMPTMAQANHFAHQRPLPAWYWSGDTRMACMRSVVQQSLRHGYAHHIQRLMVTGQFALLAGLAPAEVSAWYRAMYVDAVEWVEMPNTLGMALHAMGPRMTSKPYVASGQYIDRMSNHCKTCPYQPALRHGPQACPVTVLYWDFLQRHEATLAANPRTALMVKHVQKMAPEERAAIAASAQALREGLDAL